MKTTYYYGIIEFGHFVPSDIDRPSIPLAIIQRVDVVKEFETPEQAWQFYVDANSAYNAYSSYVSVDSVNQSNVKYQLVFQKHA
jgi:hypothetical protein